MRLTKVIESSTFSINFKFVFCLILIEGVFSIQNQKNATEDNTTYKNEPEIIEPDSNGSATIGKIKNCPDSNGQERKDSNLRSPAPVQENAELEGHTEYILESDSVHGTISSVHEEDQHPTTVSNQVPETKHENIGFQPSVPLEQIGEINLTGVIMNPFNKVQHVGFVNVVNLEDLGDHQQSVREKMVKFYDADNGYKSETVRVQPIQLGEFLHNSQNNKHDQKEFAESDYSYRKPGYDMKTMHGVLHMKPLTFERGNYDFKNTDNPHHHVDVKEPYQYVNVDELYHLNVGNTYPQVNLQKPYSLANIERPYQLVFEKHVKFPNEDKFVHTYPQHINPLQFEYLKKPEIDFNQYQKPELDFRHYKRPELELGHFEKLESNLEYFEKPESNFEHSKIPQISVDYLQPGPHGNIENFAKPESVYMTTHDHTRTNKFPFHSQHPIFGLEVPVLHENQLHEFIPKEKRVSPWKKIFHLLSAAIPLGLLFAALTPRVVSIELDNTTESNIVVSKLRSGNLPVEHKAGRLSETCEERSICEMILEGAKSNSNLVQNVLWNLSNGITDEIAKKNDLQEIFAAAKRKDCGSLTC